MVEFYWLCSEYFLFLLNEWFYWCMFVCLVELVLVSYKIVMMMFFVVLELVGIIVFDLSKVIEGFVWYEEIFFWELKWYLNFIEERFLESMVWEKGFLMFNFFVIVKVNFVLEINWLKLMVEFMLVLDILKV